MLEPVDPEYCERTVEDGDTLAVEYEGRSAIYPSVYSNISAIPILSFVASSYILISAWKMGQCLTHPHPEERLSVGE